MATTKPWVTPTYQRFVARTEIPLLILAVAFIPVIVLPEITHLTSAEHRGLDIIDYAIWVVFVAEYLTRLSLAQRRAQFVKHNLLDLALIALPMLRPLRLIRSARALRVLRLARLASLLGASSERTKRSLHARAVTYVVAVAGSLTLICSVLMLEVERSSDRSNIHSYGDALWWAVTTVSTVGYGDHYPVTAAGRIVAFVLIMTGVSLFGVVTASVAAWFVKQVQVDEEAEVQELGRRLDGLEQTLARIEARLLDVLGDPPAAPQDELRLPGGPAFRGHPADAPTP